MSIGGWTACKRNRIPDIPYFEHLTMKQQTRMNEQELSDQFDQIIEQGLTVAEYTNLLLIFGRNSTLRLDNISVTNQCQIHLNIMKVNNQNNSFQRFESVKI